MEELPFTPPAYYHALAINHHPVVWAIRSLWALLTDYRNRHFTRQVRHAIRDEQFDMVLCTTFSTFPLPTAVAIANERHIPLMMDLRDVDEQVPGAQYQSHRQWFLRPFRYLYRQVNIRRRNQALRYASAVTTISPWHTTFIQRLTTAPVHLVYNGYDPQQFYPKDIRTDKFRVSYIGRIYEFQKMEPIRQAFQELNLPDSELNIHTPEHHPIAIQDVGDTIRRSSVMIVLTSKQAKGMMTTKFYEALGCEKPVVCFPSDDGVLAQTIQQTNAGIASDHIEDIKHFIRARYAEWKQQGFTRQPIRNHLIFSREVQAQKMDNIIRDTLSAEPVTLVDVCWTLFTSNTTFDFLDQLLTAPSYHRWRRFYMRPFGHFINRVLYRLIHIDLQRLMAMQYVKDYSPEELQAQAHTFYLTYLQPRRIKAVWQHLPKQNIVIASDTMSCIAREVALQTGAQTCLNKQMFHSTTPYDIITDNLTDLRLVQQARNATIVTYHNEKKWRHLLQQSRIRPNRVTFIPAPADVLHY